MDTTFIENEQAKKEILNALDEFDNVIFLGFKKTGEACCLTVTDNPVYDKLAIAITIMLERLGREVEDEIKGK